MKPGFQKASIQELASLPQITTNRSSFLPLQVGESRGSRGRVAAGIALLQLRKQPLHSLGESEVWDVGNIFLPHQFRLSASGSALVIAGFVPGAGLQGALCPRSGQSPGLGSRSPGEPNCVYCSCKNFLVWVLLVLQPMAKSPWERLLSSSQPPLPRCGPRWFKAMVR